MILILIRHAERDHFHDQLSLSGAEQAKELAERLAQQMRVVGPRAQVRLISSPKLRCAQTAEALAAGLGTLATIDKRVDENQPAETTEIFCRRIDAFLLELRLAAADSSLIVVSHSDWLEAVAFALFAGRPDVRWMPADVHVIEISKDHAIYLSRW